MSGGLEVGKKDMKEGKEFEREQETGRLEEKTEERVEEAGNDSRLDHKKSLNWDVQLLQGQSQGDFL